MADLRPWLDTIIGLLAVGVQIYATFRMRRQEPRPASARRYWPYIIAIFLIALTAAIPATITYTTLFSGPRADSLASFAALKPEQKEAFRQALFSIDDKGIGVSHQVELVAEDSAHARASTVRDLFANSGWNPGDRPEAPKDYRLAPGITVKAPVPSLAAEGVRAAFERIGVATKRATDRSRTGDYLIVEIGPPS